MKALAVSVRLMAAALACGCAPLTFSEPGAVDFERYQSVQVVVDAPFLGDPSAYLAGALRESSGFYHVTSGAEPADLILTVQVSVTERIPSDDNDLEYDAHATYRATTPAGSVVDEGTEDDTSSTPSEAAEDVLDEVSLRYIRPYRL
jgi:hypothetical protein